MKTRANTQVRPYHPEKRIEKKFMFQFAWPWLFLILPLPWLIHHFFPPAPEQASTALKVPFFQNIVSLTHSTKRLPKKRHLKIQRLAWLIWILLVVASARPQLLGEPIKIPISGRDLLLAVDLSDSMAETDLDSQGAAESRLNIVKRVIGEFIERREGDRIGLILFGEHAYLQTPLTFDHRTVKIMLEEAVIGLAGKSTAIGDAIGLSLKRLRNRPQKNRVLILITDGSNNAGEVEPIKAAEWAAFYHLRIYTIGIGSDSHQGEIETLSGTQYIKTSFDLEGEKTLQKVAEMTGGYYFRAKNRTKLEKIYQQLDKLEPIQVEFKVFHPITALYVWFLGAAFIFSLLFPKLKRWTPENQCN
jgi:Ca-activated chloride channel family protein